jgi:hypothetical protein
MDKYSHKVKEVKNKTGRTIHKIDRFMPKRFGTKIAMEQIGNWYDEIREDNTFNSNNLMIKVLTLDGWKTLMPFNFQGRDIETLLDDYYNSLPNDVRDVYSQGFLVVDLYWKN